MKHLVDRRTVLASSLALGAASLVAPMGARAQALKGGRLRVAVSGGAGGSWGAGAGMSSCASCNVTRPPARAKVAGSGDMGDTNVESEVARSGRRCPTMLIVRLSPSRATVATIPGRSS